MNKFLNYLKSNRIPMPLTMGLLFSKIPYSKRPGIGKLYKKQRKAIVEFQEYSINEKESYIYRQFMNVFAHAYKNVPFYHELYKRHNITPENIRCYDDIKKIPIITKQDLMEADLEKRSYPIVNRLIVNTGGSSGKAFSFYMDPRRYGNEWAHIHDMWSKFNFKPSDLKLSFDGRAKKSNDVIYDFARNSLLYDIYANPNYIADKLVSIIKKHPVKYLHGYPSAMYEFSLYCETNKELLLLLQNSLKAAFLSSEFPSPHYRNKIEDVFKIPTQSFYGHTETCVLAVESEKFVYEAYQTYGFAEAIKKEDKYHLVGTSYFNFASPLIRYDTSDLIEPQDKEQKILGKFTIKEGRSGEFILDKNNKKIPLTGLIYGRHHELFNVSEHIQVYQKQPGCTTIYYVTKQNIGEDEASALFDSRSVDVEFNFKKIEKPFLTKSGKINLLIKSII